MRNQHHKDTYIHTCILLCCRDAPYYLLFSGCEKTLCLVQSDPNKCHIIIVVVIVFQNKIKIVMQNNHTVIFKFNFPSQNVGHDSQLSQHTRSHSNSLNKKCQGIMQFTTTGHELQSTACLKKGREFYKLQQQ